jgi:DDE family transposase
MASSILAAVRQIKTNVAEHLEAAAIEALCRELNHAWRDRLLGPVLTVHAFLLQVLHGNVACDDVPHLMNASFTGDAYIQARIRLPLELFQRLLTMVCESLAECRDDAARWCGHRVWLLDGSSCSMPDTPALQAAFGQPGGQRKGCGFPVAHLLTLFHAGSGLLQKVLVAPLRTHDLKHAWQMHPELAPDDVLLADRGFCSYAHLAQLFQAGLHGVLRIHQRVIVDFRKGRMHVPPSPPFPTLKGARGLPRSAWTRWLGHCDQLVEWFKPARHPTWMSAEAYAVLPASLLVRELRYRIEQPGYRTREVTLVTTLLDPRAYPAEKLAELYGIRWQVEINLRHLKQTLHLDVLHCKTVAGVHKELLMIALAYNLVRLVMLRAAQNQRVCVDRISFIDALRWLCHVRAGDPLCPLLLRPARPGRHEPRVRKRRPKQYPLMKQPRALLRKALLSQ